MRKYSGETRHKCRVRRAAVEVVSERGVSYEVGACVVCGAEVWTRLVGRDVPAEVADLLEDGGVWYVAVGGGR